MSEKNFKPPVPELPGKNVSLDNRSRKLSALGFRLPWAKSPNRQDSDLPPYEPNETRAEYLDRISHYATPDEE